MLNYIKTQLIDNSSAKYYNPNLKVILMSYPLAFYGFGYHPYGSINYSDGNMQAKKYELIHLANQRIINMPTYSDFVEKLHISPQVDSENGFLYINKPMNRYMTTTEKVKVEAVHPNKIAYNQMAIAIVRDIIGRN